jgi:hypothetical protein
LNLKSCQSKFAAAKPAGIAGSHPPLSRLPNHRCRLSGANRTYTEDLPNVGESKRLVPKRIKSLTSTGDYYKVDHQGSFPSLRGTSVSSSLSGGIVMRPSLRRGSTGSESR